MMSAQPPASRQNPLLYEINARAWLAGLRAAGGRPATLDDVPDAELDGLAAAGFDLVYLLGVWQTGPAAQAVSRARVEWREDFTQVLPDLTEADVCGSCFALTGYTAATGMGGNSALERLRVRLKERGLKLILDFVPNHTALDHPWVREHPTYYVAGSEEDLAREPQNYRRSETGAILAYGRDPYFDGWPDTFQLDYSDSALQSAMLAELQAVAARCDGVRCDMAMLALPEVFERTWGRAAEPFWPEAIAAVKMDHPGFLFIAEVYWDREWELQQNGFDFTYDKRLYDRLVAGEVSEARRHLYGALDFQERSVRFLENHDLPRAAAAFAPRVHRAAAVVTYLCPGLRFFHQGQLEGAKIRLPSHLCRRPVEPVDEETAIFYRAMLACLRRPGLHEGFWLLLDCHAAWDGNWTHDSIVAQTWRGDRGDRMVAVSNYSDHQSQCYVSLPFSDLAARRWLLRDLLSDAVYTREGASLLQPGLYLDLPAWGYHVFEVIPA